jgi:antitoxin VapB
MSLNIKDPETVQLVHELAKLTDENLTTAVKIAVRERKERLERANKGRLEWLRNLAAYTAPLLKDLPPSDKIGDLLFDKETGLPL